MSAYLIVDTEVRDPAAYEAYKREVPDLIRRHGGEYLVRGGAHEVLSGSWEPTRLVVFRFPSKAAVHAFMNDPDYAELKVLRERVATSHMVLVEGLDAPV